MVADVAEKKPDLTGFGKRLRELREAKGWSQKQLADAVGGMKQQAIDKYEREENVPNWVNVLRLADALGVKPNDFMSDEK